MDTPAARLQHARMAKIANRIKTIRKLRGLTQEQLCAETGFSQPTVSRLESGDDSFTLRTVARLAAALHVPLSQLFMKPEDFDELQEVIALFSALPPVERQRLLQTGRAWIAPAAAPREASR
jgi:transcriptional regulator with XRE-family HTH domain